MKMMLGEFWAVAGSSTTPAISMNKVKLLKFIIIKSIQ